MKTLLAAIDFSDASRAIVTHAAALATALDARVVLLHVVEPVASYVPVGSAMDVIETAPPPILPEDLAAQKAQLDRLAEGVANADTAVVVGLAAEEILREAAQRDASMIVLGSHGHGALYHLFAGSVVTGVLKRAHVPVLTIPIAGKQ